MRPREGVPARVALFHGWAESPVWYRTSDDFGPVSVFALPISKDLRDRLVAWNDLASATLSANDYEWPDEAAESEYTATGARLAEELRRELGIEVVYTSDGSVDAQDSHLEPLAGRPGIAYAPVSDETFHPEQRPAGPPTDD